METRGRQRLDVDEKIKFEYNTRTRDLQSARRRKGREKFVIEYFNKITFRRERDVDGNVLLTV